MKPQVTPQKNSTFARRLSFAATGLRGAWNREASFRTQCFAAVCIFIFCLAVRPPAVWCAAFSISATIVLALELINSSLEALIDKVHPEHASEIGFVKDCLAGAVLVASVGATLVFVLFLFSAYL